MKRDASLHRRDFCRMAAAASAVAAFSGSLRAEGAKTSSYVWIDVHTHLGIPMLRDNALTVKMMLDWMDEHHIEKVVVLPLVSPEGWMYPIMSDWVLEQTKPYRDRLLPFVDIDPRQLGYLRGRKGALDMLRRYLDAGAVGVGEHKCGVPFDDPQNLEFFSAVSELELPLLFHMDTVRNTDKPGLPGLEKALQAAPKARFIGHANGWWASVSGDCTPEDMGAYPKRPVTPGGAVDRLFDAYPNIFGDLSAGSGCNAITRDKQWGRDFLIRRADRLMFGTDYLGIGQSIPQFQALKEFDLPADVQETICRKTAEKVLNLG